MIDQVRKCVLDCGNGRHKGVRRTVQSGGGWWVVADRAGKVAQKVQEVEVASRT